MTLCLAWKIGNQPYFISDSRLTNTDKSIITDDASKVFSIPVRIFGTNSEVERNAPLPLLHQTNYGLCFAGSYLNGSLISDTIGEILSSIQITSHSDFSIDNLSNLAFEVYKQVSQQLTLVNRERGISEVLFGGNCLLNGDFKAYTFKAVFSDLTGMIEYQKNEIELQSTPVLLGDSDAKKHAESLFSTLNDKFTPFHLLQDIVKGSNFKTVGGGIQTGIFSPNNFKTYGIIHYNEEVNEFDQPEVKDEFRFRNLTLNFDNETFRSGYINIVKDFINPFEDERNEMFKKIISDLNDSQ